MGTGCQNRSTIRRHRSHTCAKRVGSEQIRALIDPESGFYCRLRLRQTVVLTRMQRCHQRRQWVNDRQGAQILAQNCGHDHGVGQANLLARGGCIGTAHSCQHCACRQSGAQNNIAAFIGFANLDFALVELAILVGVDEDRCPFDRSILHSDPELLCHRHIGHRARVAT